MKNESATPEYDRWQDDPKLAWYVEKLERERERREKARARGPVYWWAWNARNAWQRSSAEIVGGVAWAALFFLFLPSQFELNAWSWLPMKIIGSIVSCAMISGMGAFFVYLFMKA